MEVQIKDGKNNKLLDSFKIREDFTVKDVKEQFSKKGGKYDSCRQSLKDNKDGKVLRDDQKLSQLKKVDNKIILYYKDLGPQIGWSTVFLAEYAGPMLIYMLIYYKRDLFYSDTAYEYKWSQKLALYCWVGHYLKRILETLFVHRFSHQTMPLRNLAKNCSYYWGFTAFIAYFHNHQLYTPAVYGINQIYAGLALFVLSEVGNFSIHLLFMNLRPKDSKARKIPYPSWNPLTWLFKAVSCPNYTYEVMAWLGYSIMTQSLPALFFTLAGFGQMSIWALGKHRAYKKEFSTYPRSRKAIIPFIL